MLHNGAVALVAKKESKKWTVANVGSHSREKETRRDTETERQGRKGEKEKQTQAQRGSRGDAQPPLCPRGGAFYRA